MDKFFKPTLFSLLLLLSISQRVFSQNFPVDCRVLLSPPFSGQLSEVLNSPLKFRVQLLLKDLTKPSVSVSLQIRLKGQGVWLQNPEGFLASQPITLTPYGQSAPYTAPTPEPDPTNCQSALDHAARHAPPPQSRASTAM